MERRAIAPSYLLALAFLALSASSAPAFAVPVSGKLDLPPPPERSAPAVRGFTERSENPKKPIQPINLGPQLLVVLESDNTKPEGGGQVKWELVGESFSPAILGAPAGAQIVIKNTSNTARTLVALEDAKLITTGLINPKVGERQFNVAGPAVYTITDKDAPYLIGKVVVVATSHIAHVEMTGLQGKYDFADVPEGTYKLRIFFKDHWLDQTESVTVPAKGKSHEIPVVKIASLTSAPAEKK